MENRIAMYILKCSDGFYYVGSTRDLERRLTQHRNREGPKHTRKRLPVRLVYAEDYERIDDAFEREKHIQKWTRAKKEALIKGDFKTLRALAKSNKNSS